LQTRNIFLERVVALQSKRRKRIGRKRGKIMIVEITEEQRKKLAEDSKGFIPADLY